MNLQAAIESAEHKAKQDHTIMFVVYDPSDPDAAGPNDSYFPATPEQESTYYRNAECVHIVETDEIPPAKSVFDPIIQTSTPILPGFEDTVKPAWQSKHGGSEDLGGLPMFDQKGESK